MKTIRFRCLPSSSTRRPRIGHSNCRSRTLPARVLVDTRRPGRRRTRSQRSTASAWQRIAPFSSIPRWEARRDDGSRRGGCPSARISSGRTGPSFAYGHPRSKQCQLGIDGATPLPMARSDDGWFEVEAACGAGTRYRYILQDGMAVPDPASRAQDGDIHGASVVVDPSSYQWRHPDVAGTAVARSGHLRIACRHARRLRRRSARIAAAGRPRRHGRSS